MGDELRCRCRWASVSQCRCAPGGGWKCVLFLKVNSLLNDLDLGFTCPSNRAVAAEVGAPADHVALEYLLTNLIAEYGLLTVIGAVVVYLVLHGKIQFEYPAPPTGGGTSPVFGLPTGYEESGTMPVAASAPPKAEHFQSTSSRSREGVKYSVGCRRMDSLAPDTSPRPTSRGRRRPRTKCRRSRWRTATGRSGKTEPGG